MSSDNVAVDIRDLRVYFQIKNEPAAARKGGPRLVRAVDGISLKVKRGEVISLVGESGSGKTTLGRAVVALTKPTSGEVIIDGKKVNFGRRTELKGLWKKVQMVFQDPYSTFNPLSTVYDTLSTPLERFKLSKGDEETKSRIEEALRGVGLNPREIWDKYPNQLSGGQRQRVSVARAMMVEPEVIIADEPVSMIDVSLRAGILELLKDLNRKGKLTIIFITHDLAVALYISDRIAVMYRGKIVEIGSSKEIVESPLHPYTELLLRSAPRLKGEQTWSEEDTAVFKTVDPDEFQGCPFYPRCPVGVDKCAPSAPGLVEVTKGHFVACFVRESGRR